MIVKKYADKVEAGELTIEEVPSYWREKVREELERRKQVDLEPLQSQVQV